LRVLFFALSLLISLYNIGQRPSYEKIGQEELAGYEIYDINQNNSGYLIATNKGLFGYDTRSFYKLIFPSSTISDEVFSFKKSTDGALYFHNLYGQFFKLIDNKIELFFELPDSLKTPEPCFEIIANDKLIISGKQILVRVSSKGVEQVVDRNCFYSSLVNIDGKIYGINMSDETLKSIETDRVVTLKKNQKTPYLTRGFESSLFMYSRSFDHIIGMNNGNLDTLLNSSVRTRQAKVISNKLWLATTTFGLRVFNDHYQPEYNAEVIFDNTFISSIFEDQNNNILLGTFGNGIILIKNDEVLDINIPDNSGIDNLAVLNSGKVAISGRSGQVFEVDQNNQVKELFNAGSKITYLAGIGTRDKIYVNSYSPSPIIYTQNEPLMSINVSSTKDITALDSNQFLISSNWGCFYYIDDEEPIISPTFFQEKIERKTTKLYGSGRIYQSNFDKENEILFVRTASCLIAKNKNTVDTIKIKGSPVKVLDFSVHHGSLYLFSKEYGLVVYRKGEVMEYLGFENEEIHDMQWLKNKLYFSSFNRIFSYDPELKTTCLIDASSGLHNTSIEELIVTQSDIWVLSNKGLQKLPRRLLEKENFPPVFSIESIRVNGEIKSKLNELNHSENRIEITLGGASINHAQGLQFKYRLIGLDESWSINNYDQNSIQYKSLPPGTYTLEIIPTYYGTEIQVIKIPFIINSPFWNTWWFYTILSCVVVLIVVSVYSIVIKRIKKKNEILLRNEVMKKELVESQLKSIRSQMNPHFIFNSLNSIQALILKKDTEKSYDYIAEFADLVRKTLSYSNQAFIHLSDEIGFLETYLNLEKLRFNDDFHYEINNTNLEIKIPSLILQPFIENAIIHGLMHKKGPKKLTVNFELGHNLVCIIEDNGIGRTKSKEIYTRRKKSHNSFSTKAIEERLEMLSRQFEETYGFENIDLYKDGQVAGTQVILNLPFKYDS
jgi:hypothetical protein